MFLKLQKFREFLLMYDVEPKLIENALLNAHFLQVPKHSFLYYQGTVATEYYLLLSGKISMRVLSIEQSLSSVANILFPKGQKKNSLHSASILRKRLSFLKPLKRDSATDVEKMTIVPGQFFGERELIDNSPRNLSAYAQEDSIILCFSKKVFNDYFLHPIIRKEMDIRDFISSKIEPFDNLSKKEYELYYRDVKKVFPEVNEEVCKEGEFADSFYLIYQGKCSVRKKNYDNNIILLDKGDVVGLDSFTNEKKYTYSMISCSNRTILFKFDICDYHSFFVASLKTELLPYYHQQQAIINEYLKKHINLQKKMKKKYRNLSGNWNKIFLRDENKENLIINMDNVKLNEYKTNSSLIKMNKILFEKSRNFHPPLSLSSHINCLSEGNIHSHKNDKKNNFFITNRENYTTPQKNKYKAFRLTKGDKAIPNLYHSTNAKFKNLKKFTRKKYNNNNKQSVISIMDKEIDLNIKKWKISKNKKSKGLFETDNFKLPLYVLSE